jgi:hypothetical protein
MRSVSVRTDWVGDGLLALYYRVEGDVGELRLPPPRSSAHADGLWQHTCFEAFVKSGDTPAYLELNFSPSSEWAIYSFDGYRRGRKPRVPRHPPEIMSHRRGEDLLEVDVTMHLDGLFTEQGPTDRLRLALAAVLEDRRGQLSYWALAHPSARPDFHHADSFALLLPEPV